MVVLSASGDWVRELQERLGQRGIDYSLAQNPLEAVQVASATPSAVMVLDMAIHNALEAVVKAQDLRPNTKLIAVSESRPDLETALALIGAVDARFFLFPSQNITQLARVIERNENVFTAAGFRVDLTLDTAEYNGKLLALTDVEFQVLTAMVQVYNGHKRVTYRDLVWAIYHEELTDKEAITRLKTHLFNLRQKLKAAVGHDPLKTRKGIVFWEKTR